MRYLTPAEYAAMLRVHAATVRRNARSLGGIKIGTQWRFPVEDSKIASAISNSASVLQRYAEVGRATVIKSPSSHDQYAALLERVRNRRAKRKKKPAQRAGF